MDGEAVTQPARPRRLHNLLGRLTPPFEDAAASAIAHARRTPGDRGTARRGPRLSAAEQAEAQEAAKKNEGVCAFCIGTHPMPNGPGCPRIASFELDGDGRVKSATFWPGKKWAKGRLTFVEDTFEDEEEAGDGVR